MKKVRRDFGFVKKDDRMKNLALRGLARDFVRAWRFFVSKKTFDLAVFDLVGLILGIGLFVGCLFLLHFSYSSVTPTAILAYESASKILVDRSQAGVLKEELKEIESGFDKWIFFMALSLFLLIVLPFLVVSSFAFFSFSKILVIVEDVKRKTGSLIFLKSYFVSGVVFAFFFIFSVLVALVFNPPFNAILFLLFWIFCCVVWLVWVVFLFDSLSILHSVKMFVRFGLRSFGNLFFCGVLLFLAFFLGFVLIGVFSYISHYLYFILLFVWIFLFWVFARIFMLLRFRGLGLEGV
jgi:hypothetical protein